MIAASCRNLALSLFLFSLVVVQAGELVPLASQWKYFKGLTEASTPIDAWRQRGFNDASWPLGPAPFFYGESIGDGTVLSDMQNQYSTVFLRRTFTIERLDTIASATLDVRCDDGFVAWINGRLVASNRAPASVAFNALASENAPEPAELLPFNIQAPESVLRQGENTLAIQVFNVTLGSSDIVFDAQLFTTEKETTAPTLVAVSPFPGTVTNLTQVTVTFSEPVQGINASVLRVNDSAATNVTGTGATYTFFFPQPAFGTVQFSWSLDAFISDFAVPPNRFERTGANATFIFDLVDSASPFVASVQPPPNLTIRTLNSLSIIFSKVVVGVDAADLLVNGRPATAVAGVGSGPYVFSLPPLQNGSVNVSWTVNHGIEDENDPPHPLEGSSWSYSLASGQTLPRVRINEINASTLNGLKDEDGSAEDWIELYNPESFPVNLNGWSLADDPAESGRWIFPEITIPAGGYLIVFASAKDLTAGPQPHTNFRLKLAGEYLGLFSADSPRAEVSVVTYPEQRNDVSFGIDPQGQWRYYRAPTPAAANPVSAISTVVESVYFSVKRGYFAAPFNLTLHCSTPGAVIRYTMDGSEPTATTGTNYTTPVRIDRTRMVRAAAFEPNSLPSRTETHTYLFSIPATRTRLPVLSLVTGTNHLYGANGIMEVNPRNTTKRGPAWERPISVEYIRPEDNEGFQIDCGIRLSGGEYIRGLYNYRSTELPASKYSYRLYFRGDYGAGKLNYPLIPDIPITSFDEIVLRAGMNDHSNPFLRDELTRALSAEVGIVASHGTFVHLYLNGVYKGLYNPTERIGPEFLQAWHGGGEKWDIIAQQNELIEGDMVVWNRMRNIAINQNPTNPAVYQQIQGMLDVESYIDYLLAHIYADTDDWPHNNWRTARERTPEGKFRFYVWDAEFSFGFNNVPPSHNTIVNQISSVNPPWGTTEFQRFFNRLKLSPEFRLTFADRVHKHLYNGGALTDERIRARYQRMKAELAPSISGFNDYIGTTWIPQRRRHLTNHLASARFLASSNAPVFNQFGGRIPAGFQLTMTAGVGDIWYSTNGVDPRVPFTGEVNSNAVRYIGPVTLPASTLVKARTQWDTNWSAVSEATFQFAQLGIPLRITEIMYNPLGGDAFEFIELQNMGGVSVSLANFSFDGVTYRFGTDEPLLAPGARLLLASSVNLTAFRQRYPQSVVHGAFEGSVSNGGERIAVKDAGGNVIIAVEYDDENGWPAAADGLGHSLEILDANEDSGAAANWRASERLGGSPGAASSVFNTNGAVRINEVFASGVQGTNASVSADWVELFNPGNSEVDLDGWSVSDESNPRRFVFPNGTRLAGKGHLVIWCDGATNLSGLHAGFALSQLGENLYLYDSETNRIDAVSFGFQIDSHSIGVSDLNGEWTLTVPTPGSANEAVPLSASLVINEIMANPIPGEDDWLELMNLSTNFPAAIGRHYLLLSNSVSRLPELSFIPAGGFLQIRADENYGVDHVSFKLPAAGGTLVLADPAGAELDRISYLSQRDGVSNGRLPNGSGKLTAFPFTASPGAENYLIATNSLKLNEVLVSPFTPQDPTGRVAGWIEIANTGNAPMNLAGFSLGLNDPDPGEWSFPSIALPSQGFLRVWCDPSRPVTNNPAVDLNTGASLNPNGGAVYLFDAAARIVDVVEFGSQVPDRSIGASPAGWVLASNVTPGATNSEAGTLGDANQLRINEWMAAPVTGDDWVEIYNPHNLPVQLGGLTLTDDPSLYGRTNSRLANLSFIGPDSFVLLQADEETDQGPEHLNFQMNSFGETLRLYSGTALVDEILLLPQAPGVSEGRSPDGSSNIVRFPGQSTPRASNGVLMADSDNDGLPDSWEQANGFRSDDPSDAVLDFDRDGMSNLAEFRAGTDPRSTTSALLFAEVHIQGTAVELIFRATADRSYSVLSTDNLEAPIWKRVQNIEPGAAREIRVSDTPGGNVRFYRIVTPWQP
jgi:hypothetical protein